MGQAEGMVGALVDRMIRRSVRKAFHSVHWLPPETTLEPPCIFAPNHHGWHDGYVLYHAFTGLGIRVVDWIQEFDAFPPFAKVGGMPFPVGDVSRRAGTIRRTIRLMKDEKRSLLLFAEPELHPPPSLMPFGKALEMVANKVPEAKVIPVAIRYELALHERPECFLRFGEPVERGERLAERTRLEVARLLDDLAVRMHVDRASFSVLAKGTRDVNERWDMRRIPGRSGR